MDAASVRPVAFGIPSGRKLSAYSPLSFLGIHTRSCCGGRKSGSSIMMSSRNQVKSSADLSGKILRLANGRPSIPVAEFPVLRIVCRWCSLEGGGKTGKGVACCWYSSSVARRSDGIAWGISSQNDLVSLVALSMSSGAVTSDPSLFLRQFSACVALGERVLRRLYSNGTLGVPCMD